MERRRQPSGIEEMPTIRIRMSFIIILVLFSAIGLGASSQTGKPKAKPIVRQVDHIVVSTDDPKPLFDLFTEKLQLPVAWPITDYSTFVSCGVGAGNVNIEVTKPFGLKDSAVPGRTPEARFTGIAFEPYPLSESLAELNVRGVLYDRQQPYISTLPNGSKGALWTIVVLPQFSNPNLSVFLCEYNPLFLNVAIRRQQLGNRLVLRRGGPLGARSVHEIVIGTRDPGRDRGLWRKLSGPGDSSQTVLQAGSGPAIRFVSEREDRIQRIILRVASLKTAKTFLEREHLLGSVSGEEVSINQSKTQGLRISLVEK